jgi:hypothetical protein
VGMTEVLLYGAEPTEDERSKLRAHVGRMHCVPLAAIYAGYVATCLMRGEAVEDMGTFEARLRQYFMLWSDPGVWADRPVIFEGIVYGVWFNDETRRFVVDLADAVTSRRAARSDATPPMGIDTMRAEPKAKYTRGSRGIRRRQPDVSTGTISHTRQTASSNRTESPLKERANA